LLEGHRPGPIQRPAVFAGQDETRRGRGSSPAAGRRSQGPASA